MDVLRVDCAQCRARGPACADCVVSALLGPTADPLVLDGAEKRALEAMAASGMLPPLRMVRAVPKVSGRRARAGRSEDTGFALPQAFP